MHIAFPPGFGVATIETCRDKRRGVHSESIAHVAEVQSRESIH